MDRSDGQIGYTGVGIRGGAGVIFGNTISSHQHPINLFVEGSSGCTSMVYPVPDQPGDLYLWDNDEGAISKGAPNDCSALFEQGRDYFLYPPPDYAPFTYPHPARG